MIKTIKISLWSKCLQGSSAKFTTLLTYKHTKLGIQFDKVSTCFCKGNTEKMGVSHTHRFLSPT